MTTKVTSGMISADAALVDLNIDANTLYVDASANNVGVGTTSPGEKFEVKGDASYIEINHPTASSFSGMKFSEGGTPQGSIQNIGSTFSTVARRGNLEIFHNTGGNLTLQHPGGNVGIGNSSPRQIFSVTGPLVSTGALATFGSAGSYTDGDFDGTALDYYDNGARNWSWGSGSARGTFVWNQLYNDGTNQITSLKLDTGGNVVLGGISAAAREPLHVHRPSTSDAQVHLTNTATGNTSGDGLTMFVNSTTAGLWMRESGNLRFATNNTERAEFDANGMFTPAADDTYDIGSSAKRWRNMYTADLHLSNEGKQNDVDGTSGNWTIQEGENDLFLINNKNGKKFKFSLEEVE